MAIAIEAPPSRIGTIFSNPSAGVDSSRTAPIAPATAATGRIRRSHGPWPFSSGRDPNTEPTAVNTIATVFVTFAVTGGKPNHQQGGIGGDRRQSGDTAGQPSDDTGRGEEGGVPPSH